MIETHIARPGPAAGATAKPRWGMVVDLNRCVGCQTCTIACKQANDTTPDIQWRRVIDVEQGKFPDVERFFVVTGCQHCAEPPCVPVCPTGATRQRDDGLVTIDYDMCIGCAYCVVSCPYQARTIEHDPQGYYGQQTRQEKATAHPERVGVAQKCTFCQPRIDAGLAKGLMPGVDLEATPACAASCISQAIRFGDFNNPESIVSQLVREQPSLQLNEELGTNPQIRYLYTTPAVPGRGAAAESDPDQQERLADPANPLVGAVQKFWDWRAAMNWIFGGAGTGLAIFTGLLAAAGMLEPLAGRALLALAAGLVATGLFFVFLKIGRKLRFWRAVARWQTSWMTRELYVALLFFPAVLLTLLAPQRGLFLLVAVLAAAFLACQAKILHRARGIPVWRAPLIPGIIVASGILEGWGALMAALAVAGIDAPFALQAAGLVAMAASAGLWRAYVGTARANGIPPLARAVLDKAAWPVHLVGHVAPALLLALGWAVPSLQQGALLLAGVAAIAGGALWKFVVIVRASFTQGFSLKQVPQRGSGERAAPSRLAGDSRRPLST
ncbi:4Fe-4S dicluster domain-containing protein [Lacisediminimonas sp.]|uniref:4Fe-4S dicluster domain-containing protein n=1 Tax=Lacisediminimonas sp. TaxID=3060582 RepID=UPI002715B9B2|nr:4Fe-4S dicluster domain-containing protein [Lacisediminimonas sp.]MDO8300205.1 4Fe-4S dicluster domain-containing protein [Lacisediminimonas sp.]